MLNGSRDVVGNLFLLVSYTKCAGYNKVLWYGRKKSLEHLHLLYIYVYILNVRRYDRCPFVMPLAFLCYRSSIHTSPVYPVFLIRIWSSWSYWHSSVLVWAVSNTVQNDLYATMEPVCSLFQCSIRVKSAQSDSSQHNASIRPLFYSTSTLITSEHERGEWYWEPRRRIEGSKMLGNGSTYSNGLSGS